MLALRKLKVFANFFFKNIFTIFIFKLLYFYFVNFLKNISEHS
jgi:hypothetical protein